LVLMDGSASQCAYGSLKQVNGFISIELQIQFVI
jgi:hypothetical protein